MTDRNYIILKQIINKWDPIHLFPNAPDDEYKFEIEEIFKYFKSEEYDKDFFGKKIHQIFSLAFEEEVFYKTIDECSDIALEIRNNIILN